MPSGLSVQPPSQPSAAFCTENRIQHSRFSNWFREYSTRLKLPFHLIITRVHKLVGGFNFHSRPTPGLQERALTRRGRLAQEWCKVRCTDTCRCPVCSSGMIEPYHIRIGVDSCLKHEISHRLRHRLVSWGLASVWSTVTFWWRPSNGGGNVSDF